MKRLLLLTPIFLFVFRASAQQIPVIPLPNTYEKKAQTFLLSGQTEIVVREDAFLPQANYLQTALLKTTGMALRITSKSSGPAIFLSRSPDKSSNPNGYKISMSAGRVEISSATPAGLFNGLGTMLQLIPAEAGKPYLAVSCWNIEDAPRYGWRGLLLDESRHFYGKSVVKFLLDQMAYYKLNRFHWHLTDAPGWRLEIRQYPKLTLVGGIGNFSNPFAPSTYYTQEDIKEIVRYAAERFIEVIPEIDMPGHATAANKAYPEYSGGGSEAYPDFTFNPGKETTYDYLTNILRETDVLFPSQMIHLGGDEVHFGNANWNTDPAVQQLMRRQRLPDLKAVEDYFNKRMADSLVKLNNKLLLWDEAAGSDLPADKTLIFWWRHDKPEQLKLALKKGFSVVLTPRLPFYFDFVQDAGDRVGRRWEGKFNTVADVYNFSPDSLITTSQSKQVLGVQAALWTEHIASTAKLQYLLFPRIAALAEVAWTQPENKNLSEFNERLLEKTGLFKKQGIYFYNPFAPQETPEPMMSAEMPQ
jgi:hexosaminidase